ncbi:DUF3598 family protein [Argonema antarcticum]|uniref:DUF3598 family protein n=1 Tax=Argonema antarcticum TaxID=2942763 RepID=UPI002012DE53|nr:DUF3598 family protein [Argonema antarcticum]MCL1474938.1 DUF3598 family protein [Argonema antarcticum A004/B2]
MRSQWECLLENLGEWQGSFTRLSPQGELLEDTSTMVSLEGLNNNQTIRQIIRRFLSSQEVEEKVLEYSSLGRNILFFDNGAFSQGSIQLAPFSEFGAELGLIDGSRRLRLVEMFDKSGQLERLTLIREKLAGAMTPERSHLTPVDLLGEWRGEAVTIYPDWRSLDTYSTKLQLHLDNDGRLVQNLTFGDRIISSTGRIDGSIIEFDRNSQLVQVLLLPDGASCTCPLKVKVGQAFFLEVGWLLRPDRRQRLIRSYNNKGEWVALTLVKEFKVNN